MLEQLEQTFDERHKVIFKKPSPQYHTQRPKYSREAEVVQGIIKGLEKNSSSLLLIKFYTDDGAKYMGNTDTEASIKLVVDDEDNFIRILKALKTNTHLVELELWCYTITDEQASALGEALRTNHSLQTLYLYHCTLSCEAARRIALGIKENKQLHGLYLCESDLLDGGLKEIDEALKTNHFLTVLDTNNVKDSHRLVIDWQGEVIQITKAGIADISRQRLLDRNRKFAEQCAELEEKFQILEWENIILPNQNNNKNEFHRRQDRLRGMSWELEDRKAILALDKKIFESEKEIEEMWEEAEKKRINDPNNDNPVKKQTEEYITEEKKKQEEKKIEKILRLFEEMLNIVDDLKQKSYAEAPKLLHRTKKAQAQFYLSIEQTEVFFELYRDYFILHPDADTDLQFAEKLFTCDDANMLSLLGLHEEHLKYQYILKLLEGNPNPQAETFRKSAYCKLHGLHDDLTNLPFAKTIGVDRILTTDEISCIYQINLPRFDTFKLFCSLISQYYKANEPNKTKIKEKLRMLHRLVQESSTLELNPSIRKETAEKLEQLSIEFKQRLKIEEELFLYPHPTLPFIVQISMDIVEGKKIALYPQLRQKSAEEPIEILSFTKNNDEKLPELNLQQFRKLHPKLDNEMQIDRIEHQVYLKYTLAKNLGYGVYENVFNKLTNEDIISEHSRILSAQRLATLSSNFTYEQMVKILQVEYAALPDADKKTSENFFTSYRHRTLEKALENVFEKENISVLDKNTMKQSENLVVAFEILQWIGNQERSFYYKISKNPILFASMQELGKIAHEMVTCDNKALPALYKKAEEEFNKLPPYATFLSSLPLRNSFTGLPRASRSQ